MIQLLDAFKKEDNYFSVIQFELNNEILKLRFGIIESDFGHLKQILEYRPFENTGFAPYQYYFAQSYQFVDDHKELLITKIKVEQLSRNKQFEFKLSKQYLSNLAWFRTFKDKSELIDFIII